GGPGTLTLTGNNTHSSSFVGEGSLIVNGTQTTSSVFLDAAPNTVPRPILGGIGSVGAVSLKNGTLSPGTGPGATGVLTLANGLTAGLSNSFDAERRVLIDMNGGLAPGLNYDQLFVLGAVNLGNTGVILDVEAPSSFQANPGDAFVIISNDGVS